VKSTNQTTNTAICTASAGKTDYVVIIISILLLFGLCHTNWSCQDKRCWITNTSYDLVKSFLRSIVSGTLAVR